MTQNRIVPRQKGELNILSTCRRFCWPDTSSLIIFRERRRLLLKILFQWTYRRSYFVLIIKGRGVGHRHKDAMCKYRRSSGRRVYKPRLCWGERNPLPSAHPRGQKPSGKDLGALQCEDLFHVASSHDSWGAVSPRANMFKHRRMSLSSLRSREEEPVAAGLMPVWTRFPLSDRGSCSSLLCSALITLHYRAKVKGFRIIIRSLICRLLVHQEVIILGGPDLIEQIL